MSINSMELETQLIERVVEKRNDIITRAVERAEKILQAAEQEVKMIEVESEKQVLSLVGSELRAVRDRIVGKAELEGRKMVMLTAFGGMPINTKASLTRPSLITIKP